MTPREDSVTAVIPTIGRPELRSTVESVLAQTAHLHEIIVAADTDGELDLPQDSRVTVVRTGPRAGGNVARMAGIRAASSNLIALLDDDDLWAPEKLEHQIRAIRDSRGRLDDTWLSCTLVEEPGGRHWPERRIEVGERLPDYLFRKQRIKAGQGAIHTSTLLFPRALALKHPFDENLRFHQDTDWLMRLDREAPGTAVIQVPEPLTRLRAGGGSVSRGIKPLESLAWARRALAHVAPGTRADFLVTVTYFQALRHKDYSAAVRVLGVAFSWGPPTLRALPSVLMLPLKVMTRGRNL
ncbi:glycosyltransferase family 2 protein [Microbacterium sp. NPDC056052]|uniref:glycosyltransferase family 2 protein n=1 Tax=Microbacterium sp. NPDC056052 TaxID=3345695 RepID=UPI0035DAF191